MLDPDVTTSTDDWPYGYGFCHCGCGEPTPMWTESDRRRGRVRGMPQKFIFGHYARLGHGRTPAEKFWSRVDQSGGPGACWEFTGARTAGGYGHLRWQGQTTYAHRVAWMLENGPIPEGMLACHTCDNPPCCNPAHLWPGTKGENNADRSAKGRNHIGNGQHGHGRPRPRFGRAVGERVGSAKLTENDVCQIRADFAAGSVTKAGLVRQYGVTHYTIRAVLTGKSWRHLLPGA